jgi:glycosyltransferase involved in cell wall biosynthesis
VTRFVFVTQQIDRAHPTLGAAAAMVAALAARVDEVVVLASRADPASLPENARFHSFDAPGQALRGARFEAALAGELARGRPLAVLAHMSPIYALLAAPARLLRVPVLLWFTHWKRTKRLEWSERVATAVLSVDETTFPLSSAKLVAAGHGIDVDAFPCEPPDGDGGAGLRLLSLGRYSPAKGLPAILRAVRRTLDRGIDVRLDVHGPSLVADDAAHRRELEALVAQLGIGGVVLLGDALPRGDVPGALAGADALVNNMRPGAADKVVFEAAAACRPAFAAAHAFASLLPESLRFPSDDADALAERLVAFASLPRERRAELGLELREAVRRDHSVEHWADAILEAAAR